jgi:hypothetical protein
MVCSEPLLLAANMLVANSKVSPSSKPLETFAIFMQFSFYPEKRRVRFWAAWTGLREKTCVSRRKA